MLMFTPGLGSAAAQGAQLEVSAAATAGSRFQTRLGDRERTFGFIAGRAAWQVVGDNVDGISYFAEVIPLAIMTNDPVAYETVTCPAGPFGTCTTLRATMGSVVAVGGTPLGLRAHIEVSDRLSVALEGSGGILLFNKPMPDPQARRLNFTATAGPSLAWRLTATRAISIGYLWHHTSNGGTATVNPGVNSRILRVGLSRDLAPSGRSKQEAKSQRP